MTTNAVGVNRLCPRRGSTSSATAGGGATSRKYSGKRWEKWQAGKQADADMCRSLSCSPWMSATNRWWTSWRLLKSGRSRLTEWRYGAGVESDSGAGGSGSWFISSYLLSFIFYLSAGTKGSGRGAPPSSRLARRLRGLFKSCHTLGRVNIVWLNNKQQRVKLFICGNLFGTLRQWTRSLFHLVTSCHFSLVGIWRSCSSPIKSLLLIVVNQKSEIREWTLAPWHTSPSTAVTPQPW